MTRSLLWTTSALLFIAFLAGSPFVYAADTLVENLPSLRFSATDHLLFTNAENELNPGAPNPNLFLHEAVVRAEVANVAAQVHFSNRFATDSSATDIPFVLEKRKSRPSGGTGSFAQGTPTTSLAKASHSAFTGTTYSASTTRLKGSACATVPRAVSFRACGACEPA
ncbi:MAG: hypothetical protein R3B54_01685 [Bdellovibrionota bacterium]